MKALSPFRKRVLAVWRDLGWNGAYSREIAAELNADETQVSKAMYFIEANGWKKEIYGYDDGEKIVAPKGWKILLENADIPQEHREFLHRIGWAYPRGCHSTMTPMRAMVWGGVRAIAAKEG